MKNTIFGIVLLGVLAFGVYSLTDKPSVPHEEVLGQDFSFFYTSSTHATSSIGVNSWTTVLNADSSRGYATFCNNSITANDAVYLGFGATSTKPFGFRLPSGECYEMTTEKMFYGAVYGIASTATTTLLHTKASFPN